LFRAKYYTPTRTILQYLFVQINGQLHLIFIVSEKQMGITKIYGPACRQAGCMD
jgi:hypothetical protein